MAGNDWRFPPSAVTTAGADHVRLAYHYVDNGNFDAYASLLDDDMQVRGVAGRAGHGRSDATLLVRGQWNPLARHELYKVIADGNSVVAVGGYHYPTQTHLEFADVFTLADNGLLLSHRRYLAPDPHPAPPVQRFRTEG